MPTRLTGRLAGWQYHALIVVLIFLSFSPYLFFDFAFHNDFEIWAYDNKVCCSGFPETPHLIRIGRFLQAFLQNVYLSFFTDLGSLIYGRALGIAFACVGAIMLASVAGKNGMDKLSSAAFGAAVFLLPPAQVNLGWITNFIPGLFNAVLVLSTALIFPEWKPVRGRDTATRIKLGASFLLLLAALFIYPPTAGFFLIPAMMQIMRTGLAKREDRFQAAYALTFFVLACLVYFLLHRVVYMKLFDISFPESSFYRFDISTQVWGNIAKFVREIFPVMLNLWNPAPSAVIAASVLLSIIAPSALLLYRKCQIAAPRDVLSGSALAVGFWIVLFLAMNAPALLAIGRPPAFYRTWHPGMAAVLLLLFYSIGLLRPAALKKAAIAVCLVIGCAFSFDSSMHLATTLSRQFTYAVSQISAQFSPDRERYVIVEKRPDSLLFGRPRWGELGFIHILSRGHGIYILNKYFNFGIHPIIENVVVKQSENSLLLEPELLEKSSQLFPRSPADPLNRPFDNSGDYRVDTFFEKSAPLPVIVDIVGTRPATVACYKLHAGIDESPSRMPRAWRLTGSNDRRTWMLLDRQSNQISWREGESRIFTPKQVGGFVHYRIEVDAANHPQFIRVPELQLLTRLNACQEARLAEEGSVNPDLLKSVASTPDTMSVALAGTATESGLSDPPFRLQRALDNIYYTFWETLGLFPINVDFRFFKDKQIQCYALQAGDDRAHDRMPRAWKLFGSRDGKHWDVLDSRNSESKWADNSRRTYTVSSPARYRAYRIQFLSINGGSHLRLYDMALSEDRACTRAIP